MSLPRFPPRARVLAAALLLLLAALACAAPVQAPVPVVSEPPPSPWAQADARALAAPPEMEDSVPHLAAYLTEGLSSDGEKVRSIFRWVTSHVRYDMQGFRTAEYGDFSPRGVLRSRRAVCEGYSGLFEALAQAAGIEVATIHGFAKGVGYTAGDPVPMTYNHAWNAVKVEGIWRLLDCTWGAGALDEKGEYVAAFDPFYFFTPPEAFIYTHFPSDPAWQLLGRPLRREAFEALPQLKPAFFTCGLSFSGVPTGHLRVPGAEATIAFEAPADVEVKILLLQGEIPLSEAFVRASREGDRLAVSVLAPEAGTFVLRLFAARGLNAETLDWAADLLVTAGAGTGGKGFSK